MRRILFATVAIASSTTLAAAEQPRAPLPHDDQTEFKIDLSLDDVLDADQNCRPFTGDAACAVASIDEVHHLTCD